MKNWGLCVEMYGSMEADFDFQRTTKRAELTAFLVPPQESDWTHQNSCGQQGIIDGLRKR